MREDRLFVNLYAQSEATVAVKGVPVKLAQRTDYPWDGAIKLSVSPEKATKFEVAVRIPGWVVGHPVPSDLYTYENARPSAWSVRVNGEEVKAPTVNGYFILGREWKTGDVVTLDLPTDIHHVAGHAKIAATRGRVALERGPVVYCLEKVEILNAWMGVGAVQENNSVLTSAAAV